MKNLKYFPFERNKYFYGKLLTVSDFESEQKYFNDKRRLLNRLLFGSGIVCGLNTVKVDDTSISVEMGMALDYAGREIVLDNPVIKKLSTIDGFESSSLSKKLYLCIEYAEREKEPVHSISGTSDNEERIEHNKYKEVYRLFISEEEPEPSILSLSNLYENVQTLYNDNKIKVTHLTPKYVNSLGEMYLTVIVENNQQSPFSFFYEVDMPCFTTSDGSNSLKVSFNGSDKEEKTILKFKLKADKLNDTKTDLIVKPESFKMTINDSEVSRLDINCRNSVNIINSHIREAIKKDYFSLSMDEITKNISQHRLYLAQINILNVGETYVIENIKNNPFSQYILNSSLNSVLLDQEIANNIECTDNNYFDDTTNIINNSSPSFSSSSLQNSFTTGVVEIPLGLNPKYNKKYFTEEIIHGLGKGPVYIDLGVEYEESDNNIFNLGHQIIFGDSQIFSKSQYEPSGPLASTGAVTYADKGTFVIGIKLLSNTESSSIKVRWRAYKDLNDNSIDYSDDHNNEFFIRPDTMTLSPRESGHFKVICDNNSNISFNWSIVEAEGGTIDSNGFYTAPSKEGVYEINAESSSDPKLKASAFVIVKEK
ncbi:hypothetical protein RBH29_02745 [Herbivorax sp. ANBcel31]|uniref:hypothetical protein n=1 Tax=Herbivorax sp. ANBcel31 TaxID=3069754 RepID=UPI0027B22111|nr:hypothetical protein [Herbivorax sp. ANBcel31]MDQ2085356.1 hypothetical protein [Herbivorax sp. ANBcel31]